MPCREIIEISGGACQSLVTIAPPPCRQVIVVREGIPGPPGPPGPPGGGSGSAVFQLEGPFTLSAGDVTNGFITVTQPLVNAINAIVQLVGGPDLIPEVDFTWQSGSQRITFAAHILSRLQAGDTVWVRRLISSS